MDVVELLNLNRTRPAGVAGLTDSQCRARPETGLLGRAYLGGGGLSYLGQQAWSWPQFTPPPGDSGGQGHVVRSELVVSQGQVTFDAEGDDNPHSRYFSRKIHWPGTAEAGVTLGRGYDMGQLTPEQVIKDLTTAGLAPPRAVEFAKGAGKRGQSAGDFVRENREKLGEITHAVQKALFELTYPLYVERARQRYAFHTKGQKAKPWEQLHPAIRDVLVDFVYQGYGRMEAGFGRPLQKGMENDFDELIKYIEQTPSLMKWEAGRRRAEYLRRARPRPGMGVK